MDPHWINRLVAFQDVGENVPSRIHLNQERPEDSSGLEDLSSNHEKVGTILTTITTNTKLDV